MANKKKKKVVKKNNALKKGTKRKKRNIKKKNRGSVSTSSSNKTIKSTASSTNSGSAKGRNGKTVSKSKGTKEKVGTLKSANTSKKINTNRTEKNNKKIEKNASATKEKAKNKVNAKFKIYIIFILFLLLLVTMFLLYVKNSNKDTNDINFHKIDLDKYLELYKSEKLEFVYLYHNSCVNCEKYEVNLNKLEAEFNIKINKFDYSKLNDDEISTLKSSNSALSNGIDVPMLLAIKDGEGIKSISGVKEYSAMKKFVDSSKNPLDVKLFTKIRVDDYLSLLGSKSKSFIYICNQTSNVGCEKFTPILESVARSRKLKVNYLNTDTINTSADWDKLDGSSKIFGDSWFMPAILIVKDGKIIDYKMEVLNEKDLIKFLKNNGL